MNTWLQECAGSFGRVLTTFPEGCQIPLREWTNAALKFLVRNFGNTFDSLSSLMLVILRQVETFLVWLPWWVVTAIICVVAWSVSRNRWFTLAVAAGLIFIGMMDLWEETMPTLAILFIAISLTVAVGVPLGILMATTTTRLVRSVITTPILDAMQTEPPFVYLVPFVFFFGLGNVAGIFAIFVYSLPPIVRLTDLGIRLVDSATVEAADAFGATGSQILWGVRIPLAMRTIMAGVNQSIMMALAMVVFASMIGVRGLGQQVLRGLNNGDVGMALEAGLAILALAIIFDRIAKAFGVRLDPTQTESGGRPIAGVPGQG